MKKIALFLFVGILATTSTIAPLSASTATNSNPTGEVEVRGFIGISGDTEEPETGVPGKNLKVTYPTSAYFKWVSADAATPLTFAQSPVTITNKSFFQNQNGSHTPKDITVTALSMNDISGNGKVKIVANPTTEGEVDLTLNGVSMTTVNNTLLATVGANAVLDMNFVSNKAVPSATDSLYTDYALKLQFAVQ
ncbi:MAG: hypothetical protein ACRC5R_02460 [Mycoplasmatales bacterium]